MISADRKQYDAADGYYKESLASGKPHWSGEGSGRIAPAQESPRHLLRA